MRKALPFVLVTIAALISALVAPHLPDIMTVHWDWQGRPDGVAPKWLGVAAMPALMLLMIGLFHLLPRVDSMRESYGKFWPEYQSFISATCGAILVMHVAMLMAAMGKPVPMLRVALIIIGILFTFIGNLMPRIRRNHVAGFRTAATLASEPVWTKTHRVGGAIMMGTGLLIALAAFAPERIALGIVMLLVAAMVVSTTIYSNRVARGEREIVP